MKNYKVSMILIDNAAPFCRNRAEIEILLLIEYAAFVQQRFWLKKNDGDKKSNAVYSVVKISS